MTIYGVSVSATDLPRARAFYELLGFRFPEADPDHQHLEAEDDSGVRLMVESASSLAALYGEPPRPGTTAPAMWQTLDQQGVLSSTTVVTGLDIRASWPTEACQPGVSSGGFSRLPTRRIEWRWSCAGGSRN